MPDRTAPAAAMLRFPRALALAAVLLLALAASAAAAPTYVSLGFDDGSASHYAHRSILAEHDARATFYVNTARLGQAGSMTWAQLAELAAAGHVVGGHTLDHVRLTTTTFDEQIRQVCDDRAALVARGYAAKHFAYPNGANDATVRRVVADCGYQTGRTTGGTDFPSPCCVFAETIPPRDSYRLRALQPRLSTPLSTLQDAINRARFNGGGWVELVLHGICADPCTGASEYAIPASRLDALLDWIDTLPDTEVRSISQLMALPADRGPPAVSIAAPADGATVSGTVQLQAAASDDQGVERVELRVDGVVVGIDTTAPYTAEWDSSTAGATATITARAIDKAGNATISAAHVVTVGPAGGAPPTVELTAPADGAIVVGTVALTADAADDVAVDRVEFLVGGTLVGTDASAPYGVDWDSSTAGATATIVARALDVGGNATTSAPRTVTVAHPDTTPPAVALTAPANGAAVRGIVALQADASDANGVERVEFLVGGAVVGTDTSAPYAVDWDAATAGGSTATIAARAVDLNGNAATSASRTVTIVQPAPTVVTLGFDDGAASHFTRRSILDEHGVKATFFVNTGTIGRAGALTWAQVAQLAAEGHEIGGHTLDHVRLTSVPLAEQQRQVCDDRAALLAHGFEARNFAYPFGANDATTKSVVAGCGYATARTTGGTDFPRACCVFAETVPPKDPYRLRALQPRLTTPLSTLQDAVNRARYSGGGWVNLVLHQICDDPCTGASEYAIAASTLDGLLDWIATQPGVTVRTTAQALRQPSDTTAPTVSLTAPASGATVRGTVTVSASASDNVGVAGVEFLVNGILLATDTVSPYSVSWRTATLGSATLQARARDAAGNAATSASRTVRVTS